MPLQGTGDLEEVVLEATNGGWRLLRQTGVCNTLSKCKEIKELSLCVTFLLNLDDRYISSHKHYYIP